MQWICIVCGFVYEGDTPPEFCPVCKVGKDAFKPLEGNLRLALEHEAGLARGADPSVVSRLKAMFLDASQEAAQYLAFGRAADREGYPDAAHLFMRIAQGKIQQAGVLKELLGDSLTNGTGSNLDLSAQAEAQACAQYSEAASLADSLGHEGIRDALRLMARDAAQHSRALHGLAARLFPGKQDQ